MYDAIVIGARCAGASTAMLLGRLGHKVLLVDKTAVGTDIPHGHFIHRQGPQPRLKLPGAAWLKPNLTAIAGLRAGRLSGRRKNCWHDRSAA